VRLSASEVKGEVLKPGLTNPPVEVTSPAFPPAPAKVAPALTAIEPLIVPSTARVPAATVVEPV
jgi:hypothetical protein